MLFEFRASLGANTTAKAVTGSESGENLPSKIPPWGSVTWKRFGEESLDGPDWFRGDPGFAKIFGQLGYALENEAVTFVKE
jgi:hypothetical protein